MVCESCWFLGLPFLSFLFFPCCCFCLLPLSGQVMDGKNGYSMLIFDGFSQSFDYGGNAGTLFRK